MTDVNIVVSAQTGGAVKGIESVTRATKQMGGQVQVAQAKVARLGSVTDQARIKTRKFAMGGLQQAGYQVGDYAVQVANGTSKMQAFGQQAPQLLQIFGPIGSVVGAAVAIFAAFAVVMQKTKDAAKELKPEIVDLSAAFDSLESVDFDTLTKAMSAPAKAAAEEYRGILAVMREVAEKQRNTAIQSLIKGIAPQAEIAATEARLKEVNRLIEQAKSQGMEEGDDGQFDRLLASQSKITSELDAQRNLNSIILGLQADTREQAALNLEDATNTLSASGLLSDELKVQLSSYADQVGILGVIASEVKGITSEEKSLADATDASAAAAENIRRAYGGYYSSRVAGSIMAAQAELSALDVQIDGHKAYAKGIFLSRKVAAQQNSQIAVNQMAAWKQYYDSRIMGEHLVAQAALAASQMPQVGRSRGVGGATHEELSLHDLRVQLAAEEARIRAKLNALTVTGGTSAVKAVKEQADAINTQLTPAAQRLNAVQNMVSGSIESGLMAMIDGTKSVKEAFKSMASEIIKELYRIFVVKQITGLISGFISDPAMFNGMGGVGSVGSVRPVGRPNNFAGGGYTGNGARAGGLDGKGGYMAMMHPQETVIDHTKGQAASGVTVIQNNTFGNGVNRAEIQSMLPKLVEASKAAVLDAKRRGGSYGSAF